MAVLFDEPGICPPYGLLVVPELRLASEPAPEKPDELDMPLVGEPVLDPNDELLGRPVLPNGMLLGRLLAIPLFIEDGPVFDGLKFEDGVFKLVANWSFGGVFFQNASELPIFCMVAQPDNPATKPPSTQTASCFHPFRMTISI